MVDRSDKKKQTKGYELPFSLIESEILSRVPGKSDIGRCRCVCRQWKSFLSTPMFNQMHLRYHVSINEYKLLVFDGQPPIPFRKLHLNEIIPNPNPNHDPDISILASVDGLVCLAATEVPDVTLVFWNPLNGSYKRLPSLRRYNNIRVSAKDPVGFYIDSSNDYKLLFLISKGRGGAHIYSHRSDSWRQIESIVVISSKNFLSDPYFWRMSTGTFCGRCVYFIFTYVFYLVHIDRESHSCVVCFDVETETFRKIPFPPIHPDAATKDCCGSLVVLNGYIHLCVSYEILGLKQGELWRMEDGDKWVKIAAFNDSVQQQRRVCTASTGNWLALVDQDDNSFKKISTEDFITHYRYFCSPSSEYRSTRIIYAESLVSV